MIGKIANFLQNKCHVAQTQGISQNVEIGCPKYYLWSQNWNAPI